MDDKKIKLVLELDKSVYRIMKQRRNRYMRKKKMKELDWETFIMIKVF